MDGAKSWISEGLRMVVKQMAEKDSRFVGRLWNC